MTENAPTSQKRIAPSDYLIIRHTTLNPYTGGKVLFNVFNLDTGSGSSSDIVSGIAFEAGGFTIWQNQIVDSSGGVTSINASSGAQGRQTWRQLPTTSTGN